MSEVISIKIALQKLEYVDGLANKQTSQRAPLNWQVTVIDTIIN